MKKLLALIVFTGCIALGQAQSRINVRTANEADFILFLNDVQVNNVGVISLTLDNITQQKVNLKVNFPAQPDKSFQQTLALKKNTAVYYDIEEVKGAYKFVLKSESSVVINSNKNTIVLTPSVEEASGVEEAIVETALENANCPDYVNDQNMLAFTAEIMEVRFESQKLSKMKALVDVQCVNAEQLGILLLSLSMEDNKMDLVEYAFSRVYDPSNLKGIENHFFLERNKRKVSEMLNK